MLCVVHVNLIDMSMNNTYYLSLITTWQIALVLCKKLNDIRDDKELDDKAFNDIAILSFNRILWLHNAHVGPNEPIGIFEYEQLWENVHIILFMVRVWLYHCWKYTHPRDNTHYDIMCKKVHHHTFLITGTQETLSNSLILLQNYKTMLPRY